MVSLGKLANGDSQSPAGLLIKVRWFIDTMCRFRRLKPCLIFPIMISENVRQINFETVKVVQTL